MNTEKTNLVGLSRAELAAHLADMGEKPFRTKQLWHWIYFRGETDFSRMTTLAKDFRARLAESCSLERPGITTDLHSEDKSHKWLLKFAEGHEAECVFIPEEDRGALCVSSQVGCTLTCKFCHTGTRLFSPSLTSTVFTTPSGQHH